MESVVVVRTANGFGAGFVINSMHVVTSFHVVRGERRITVRTHSGTEHNVTAVPNFDADDDLAVLKIEPTTAPELVIGDSTALKPGDPVTVIGHPSGLEATVSTGVVAAVRDAGNGRTILQVTAPISPGSSGGPVLNDQGYVVGITRGLLPEGQALNFATASWNLIRLLGNQADNRLSLDEFAKLTASGSSKPSRTLAAKPASSQYETVFPPAVAGFTFGMKTGAADYLCADSDQQDAAKRGRSWYTQMDARGVYATCPFAPQPLDFAKGEVTLKFGMGVLTVVILEMTNWTSAYERISNKYGPPMKAQRNGKWVDVPSGKKQGDLAWNLKGGNVALIGKQIYFVSEDERQLSSEGF